MKKLLVYAILMSLFAAAPAVAATKVVASTSDLAYFAKEVGSALGILLSFWLDTPTGATIVVVFGLILILFAVFRGLSRPISAVVGRVFRGLK